MNKKELIEAMAARTDTSTGEAKRVVSALIGIISDTSVSVNTVTARESSPSGEVSTLMSVLDLARSSSWKLQKGS